MDNSKIYSNVVIFTRGTKGDLYPFIELGRGLKKQGSNVKFCSNYCYESYARNEGFEFFALDDQNSFETLNHKPEFHTNLASKLQLSREHIVANLEREFRILSELLVQDDTVIIAHSNDYLAPLFVKDRYGVPLFLCMLAPSYVYGFNLFACILESLSSEVNKIRCHLGLEQVADWEKWLSNYDHIFAVWPEWFSEETEQKIPWMKYLGFLSISDIEQGPLNPELADFFDKAEGQVALLTHGTSRPFHDNYFESAIGACQKLGLSVIISTPFRELLPSILPNKMIWVDFAAFHKVMPHLDIVIHHGGIGTVRESIAHNVPQLIVGQGFDRQHNGRVVKKLGFGDCIMPGLVKVEALYEAIRALLYESSGSKKCGEYNFELADSFAVKEFYRVVLNVKPCKPPRTIQQNIIEPCQHSPSQDDSASYRSDVTVERREYLTRLLRNKVKEAAGRK